MVISCHPVVFCGSDPRIQTLKTILYSKSRSDRAGILTLNINLLKYSVMLAITWYQVSAAACDYGTP